MCWTGPAEAGEIRFNRSSRVRWVIHHHRHTIWCLAPSAQLGGSLIALVLEFGTIIYQSRGIKNNVWAWWAVASSQPHGDIYCLMKGALAERTSGGHSKWFRTTSRLPGSPLQSLFNFSALRFSFHFVNSYLIPSHEELNSFLSHCVGIYISLIWNNIILTYILVNIT